mgnify:CR=1 FL=1
MSYIGSKPADKALTASDITDGIISTAKLASTSVTSTKTNNDIISGETALGATPADTDEFLVSDAGVLKRMDYSHIKGGGKVLQVVQDTLTSVFSSTSSSFVQVTDLTCAITPAATSSKILVLINGCMFNGTASGFNYVPTIYRDTTNLGHADNGFGSIRAGGSTLGSFVALAYLDSPSSTSELDYKYYFKVSAGTGYMSYNVNSTSTMQVIEIGA